MRKIRIRNIEELKTSKRWKYALMIFFLTTTSILAAITIGLYFFDIKKDIERYGSINGYANDILRTTCESFKRNVKFTNKVHDGLNVNNGKTFFTYNVSPHISLYYKINYEIYTGEDDEINKIKRTISFEDYDVLKIVTIAINNEPNFDGFYEKLFELFDRADDYVELSKYIKKRYTLESLYSLAKKHMSDIYSHINEKKYRRKNYSNFI